MTEMGGGRGGFRIFPELREVLGYPHAKFQVSRSIPSYIDYNFCKNDRGGGEGGAYYP